MSKPKLPFPINLPAPILALMVLSPSLIYFFMVLTLPAAIARHDAPANPAVSCSDSTLALSTGPIRKLIIHDADNDITEQHDPHRLLLQMQGSSPRIVKIPSALSADAIRRCLKPHDEGPDPQARAGPASIRRVERRLARQAREQVGRGAATHQENQQERRNESTR